jgi:hypothetical protein
MVSIGIRIDVPDLTEGVRFYSEAFGFSKSAAPVPGPAPRSASSSNLPDRSELTEGQK